MSEDSDTDYKKQKKRKFIFMKLSISLCFGRAHIAIPEGINTRKSRLSIID